MVVVYRPKRDCDLKASPMVALAPKINININRKRELGERRPDFGFVWMYVPNR